MQSSTVASLYQQFSTGKPKLRITKEGRISNTHHLYCIRTSYRWCIVTIYATFRRGLKRNYDRKTLNVEKHKFQLITSTVWPFYEFEFRLSSRSHKSSETVAIQPTNQHLNSIASTYQIPTRISTFNQQIIKSAVSTWNFTSQPLKSIKIWEHP